MSSFSISSNLFFRESASHIEGKRVIGSPHEYRLTPGSAATLEIRIT